MEELKQSDQVQFLKNIEDILPISISFVHELCDLLEISQDSAYRRLRGETTLSFEEILKICRHYNISFDSYSSVNPNSVTFSYDKLGKDKAGFLAYLKNLKNNIQMIKNAPNCEIIYAARDIPIFQNYCYPMFSAFKMFYYMKSIMNVTEFETEPFDPALVPEEYLNLALEIYKAYLEVPSIEIWTDQSIYSTLKQIEFYWEAGLFKSKEDALKVCEELGQQISDIQRNAAHSSKYSFDQNPVEKNNYRFYNSDVEIANNTVLVKLGDMKMVFHSHHTFYIMSTSNKHYIEETALWLDNIMKKSTLISGVAEKQRYQFFKKINKGLQKLQERISEDL